MPPPAVDIDRDASAAFRRRALFRLIVVALPIGLGCVNDPGALRLDVRLPHAELLPDEPLRIDTSLTAVRGPVCLSRSHYFTVEVRPQAPATRPEFGRTMRGFCGTPFMALWPLFPILYPAAWLDVLDLSGRYRLLSTGASLDRILYARPERFGREGDCVAVVLDDPDRTNRIAEWRPGHYEAIVRLQNRNTTWFPAPLFWRVFEPEVVATVKFAVMPRR